MCHHIRTGSLPLGKKDEDKYDNLLIIPNSKLPVRMLFTFFGKNALLNIRRYLKGFYTYKKISNIYLKFH